MTRKRSDKKPPRSAEWLIGRIYPDRGYRTSIGDFREEYQTIAEKQGIFRARLWYGMQIIRSVPAFVRNKIYWGAAMFSHYLKIAFRQLARQHIFSVINISGLAIGLAGAVLILLFVQHESSYDRFHANSERLYRIYTNFHAADGSIDHRSRGVPLAMGPTLEDYFPEILHSVRIHSKPFAVKHSDSLTHERITWVDKGFFRVFSFPLLSGHPDSVFAQGNSLVISEPQAHKYFGDDNPMGKSLILINGRDQIEFVISGVAAAVPENSTITFDFLIDMETAETLRLDNNFNNWEAFGWQNYVLLAGDADVAGMSARFAAYTPQYLGPYLKRARQKGDWTGAGLPLSFGLQKITGIHLDPAVRGSADLRIIFLLSAIATIVMVIAIINFTNLAVSRASSRGLEVGMRKVMGADRRQLIRQFWGESILITFVATVMGLLLVGFALPTFNHLAGRNLSFGILGQPVPMLCLLLLVVSVGLLSGSYPALIMSRFAPAATLKSGLKVGGRKLLSKVLVVIQFALSVFLIIASITMGRQIDHMIGKDPGFDREGVIVLDNHDNDTETSRTVLTLLRNRLQAQPQILSVTGTSFFFDDSFYYPFRKEGREIMVIQNRIDYDYFKTLGIEVVQGRSFSPEYAADLNAAVVNEKFIEELGMTDPLGKWLPGYYKKLTIIGVVKDYNFKNLRSGVAPVLHHMNPAWGIDYILVRMASPDISATLKVLETAWKAAAPQKPFAYSFLDEDLEAMYAVEKKIRSIVTYSSFLAVLIACMGIFGLTAITVDRKSKEIGIRKVLGASESQIVKMLAQEFVRLVAIANLMAWPLAYFAMRTLLDNYHYRISLGPQYFLLAGILSFAVAVMTTIFLAVKAALADPVDSLRYE